MSQVCDHGYVEQRIGDGPCDICPLLQRARDVETLDAWATIKHGRAHDICKMSVGEWWARVWEGGQILSSFSRPGQTPDAARHAAAEAIRKGEV